MALDKKGELVFTDSMEFDLDPGLYDKNYILIASWEELVDQHDIKNTIEGGGCGDSTCGVIEILED